MEIVWFASAVFRYIFHVPRIFRSTYTGHVFSVSRRSPHAPTLAHHPPPHSTPSYVRLSPGRRLASKYPTQEGLDLYIHSKRLPKCFQLGGDGGGSALLPEACPSGNKLTWTGHTTLVLPGPLACVMLTIAATSVAAAIAAAIAAAKTPDQRPPPSFLLPPPIEWLGGGLFVVTPASNSLGGVTGMGCGCSGLLCEKKFEPPRGGSTPKLEASQQPPRQPNPPSPCCRKRAKKEVTKD